MIQILTHNVTETEQAGGQLASRLSPGAVVAFTGDLGAGKTAFCRGFLHALGYTGRVTSPTFAIVNEYETELCRVCHFDMYRILDEDALYDQREDVAEEINEILLHRLKNNIRFCPLCGKALPLHHRGRVCDACYRRMRK